MNRPLPWRSLAVWALVVLALALTWGLYTNPHFMVGLADQLWSCF